MGKKTKPTDATAPGDVQDETTDEAETDVKTASIVGHAYDVEVPHCHLGKARVVVPIERMEEGATAALDLYKKKAALLKTEHVPTVSLIGPVYSEEATGVNGQ